MQKIRYPLPRGLGAAPFRAQAYPQATQFAGHLRGPRWAARSFVDRERSECDLLCCLPCCWLL